MYRVSDLLFKGDDILFVSVSRFILSIHSSTDTWVISTFLHLAVVNSVVKARVSSIPSWPCLTCFGYTPRRRIAGSHGYSMLQFVRNHHIVSHSSCKILHSHQQLSASLPTLLFSFFKIVAIIVGGTWHLTVIVHLFKGKPGPRKH